MHKFNYTLKNTLNNFFGEVNPKTKQCRFWNHKMVYKPKNITSESNQAIDGKPIIYKYHRDILECSICGKKTYGDTHFGHTSFAE